MFGFFKKKVDKEQILNKGIFLFHFENMFAGSGVDTENYTIENKILMFSVTLASLVSSDSKDNETYLKESNSYERAASIIIYVQAVLTISEFVKLKDKEVLADVLNSGMHRLICTDFCNATPQEHADMALSTMLSKKLNKENLEEVLNINQNILDFLFHRKDVNLNNLRASWGMITKMIS